MRLKHFGQISEPIDKLNADCPLDVGISIAKIHVTRVGQVVGIDWLVGTPRLLPSRLPQSRLAISFPSAREDTYLGEGLARPQPLSAAADGRVRRLPNSVGPLSEALTRLAG